MPGSDLPRRRPRSHSVSADLNQTSKALQDLANPVARLAGQRRFDWAVTLFFVGAFAFAWAIWWILAGVADGANVDVSEMISMIEAGEFAGIETSIPGWALYGLTRLIDFSFSLAGVVAIASTSGVVGLRTLWSRLVRWRIRPRWYLLGLLPLGLFGLSVLLAGGEGAEWKAGHLGTLVFSLEAGLVISLFLRGAMGEELGLRGFALPRLQEKMSPLSAALLIGVLWGGWHLPVLVGRGVGDIVGFMVLAVGVSCVLAWLFNGSGGSLIPPLLFHATQNWEEAFETVFPRLVGTNWELPSTLALVTLGVVAAVMLTRRRLGQVVTGLVEQV